MQKILFEQTTKPGTGMFQIRERDTCGMRGIQDKFSMYVLEPNVEAPHDLVEYRLGSHPSLEGAKKFARNRGLI